MAPKAWAMWLLALLAAPAVAQVPPTPSPKAVRELVDELRGLQLRVAPLLLSTSFVSPGTLAPRLLAGDQNVAAVIAGTTGATTGGSSALNTWSATAAGQLAVTGTLALSTAARDATPMAWLVGAGRPLVVTPDLWAFQALDLTPSSVSVDAWGRGVLLPGGKLYLPRRGHPPTPTADADPDAAALARGLSTVQPGGIMLEGCVLRVVLTGLPAQGVLNATGTAAASLGEHTIVFSSTPGGPLAVTVPIGQARPGYVYRLEASLSGMTAKWSYRTDVVPWAVPAPVTPSTPAVAQQYNPNEVVASLVAPAARQPLLYTHAPPYGGVLNPSPESGSTLAEALELSTSGWVELDGFALLDSALPPQAQLAAGVASLLPWMPFATEALGSVVLGGSWAGVAAAAQEGGPADTECRSALPDSAVSLATLPSDAPAWARALVALAEGAGVLPSPACSQGLLQVGLRRLLTASATSSWGMTAVLSPPEYSYTFRFDGTAAMAAAGRFPLALAVAANGALPWWQVATLPGLLVADGGGDMLQLPGTPFAAPSSAAALSTIFPAPDGGTLAGRMVLIAAVTDAWGSVNLALRNVTAAPLLPPYAGPALKLTLLSAAAANLAITGVEGGLPPAAALKLIASMLPVLSEATAVLQLQEAPADGAALLGVARSLREALVMLMLTATEQLLPSMGSATATGVLNALAALTSVPAELTKPARMNATAVVRSIFGSAVRSMFGGATYGPFVLPAGAPTTALSVLTNVVVASALGRRDGSNVTGSWGPINADGSLALGNWAASQVVPTAEAPFEVQLALQAVALATLGTLVAGSAPTAVSSAPGGALHTHAGPSSDYCGPALTMVVARIPMNAPAGGQDGDTVSVQGLALSPCSYHGKLTTLPAGVVAAQPPPTLALPRRVLRQLVAASSGNGSTLDVMVVQWGASPVPETAGLSQLAYAPPLVTLTQPIGSSSGSVAAALAATLELYLAAAPIPLLARDMCPMRGGDTRIVSVSLPTTSGAPMVSFSEPVRFTLPLRDVSIVQWDASSSRTAGIDVGNPEWPVRVVEATCPFNPADARAGIRARYVPGTAMGGQRAAVRLVHATALPTPSNSTQPWHAYLLATDCGFASGERVFACGPGLEGINVTFSCPRIRLVPHCLWFDTTAGGWSLSGCMVAGVSETAIMCACTHLPPFIMARFAALMEMTPSVFAGDAAQAQTLLSPAGATATASASASPSLRPTGARATLQLGSLPLVARLSAAQAGACALDDAAALTCWGFISDGTAAAHLQPLARAVPACPASAADRLVAVSVGTYGACALTLGGEARCWDAGHMPLGSRKGLTAISSGGTAFACGLTALGAAVCWGPEAPGNGPSTGQVAVVAGLRHACSLSIAAAVTCWGGEALEASVAGAQSDVVAVAAGSGPATCALKANGSVLCWSQASTCGTSSLVPPAAVQGDTVSIAVGVCEACAISAARRLTCWGLNVTVDTVPPDVAHDAAASAVGSGYACAIKSFTGGVRCWASTSGLPKLAALVPTSLRQGAFSVALAQLAQPAGTSLSASDTGSATASRTILASPSPSRTPSPSRGLTPTASSSPSRTSSVSASPTASATAGLAPGALRSVTVTATVSFAVTLTGLPPTSVTSPGSATQLTLAAALSSVTGLAPALFSVGQARQATIAEARRLAAARALAGTTAAPTSMDVAFQVSTSVAAMLPCAAAKGSACLTLPDGAAAADAAVLDAQAALHVRGAALGDAAQNALNSGEAVAITCSGSLSGDHTAALCGDLAGTGEVVQQRITTMLALSAGVAPAGVSAYAHTPAVSTALALAPLSTGGNTTWTSITPTSVDTDQISITAPLWVLVAAAAGAAVLLIGAGALVGAAAQRHAYRRLERIVPLALPEPAQDADFPAQSHDAASYAIESAEPTVPHPSERPTAPSPALPRRRAPGGSAGADLDAALEQEYLKAGVAPADLLI